MKSDDKKLVQDQCILHNRTTQLLSDSKCMSIEIKHTFLKVSSCLIETFEISVIFFYSLQNIHHMQQFTTNKI